MGASDSSLVNGGSPSWKPTLGAWFDEKGAHFRVWSARAKSLELVWMPEGRSEQFIPLDRASDGTYQGLLAEATPGDRYLFRIDGKATYPDPASRYQPEGVHGPSALVDARNFSWTDQSWCGISRDELVIYEVHVGTFSPRGTFAGVTERLAWLADLGVTAIELMPVADFPGERSWGYDGVDLFAPARCYGTPDELRHLVNEAHRLGLAVLLDVVYNHFGPMGNYAVALSPSYLSNQYESDWGTCVNLDGEGSEMVRAFFIENAQYWIHEFHMDGLRLDATHELRDRSATHFLAELSQRVRSSTPNKPVLLIAEDHRNLTTIAQPVERGGLGLDGVWADDFHHQIRRFLAGDHEGYYRDYTGLMADLVETIDRGWYYRGQQSVHLGAARGTDARPLDPRAFVVCIQNHDQIGNRAFGERLNTQIPLAAFRAASTLLLMLPETPLLFMGQEWAATSPFLYFTDHEEELGRLVTEGRRKEFRHFLAFVDVESRNRIPDPQAATTFDASHLDWTELERPDHAATLALYRALLALRRTEPALRARSRGQYHVAARGEDALVLERTDPTGATLWIVVRLRGDGAVRVLEPSGRRQHSKEALECLFTTEDPKFCTDAQAPELEETSSGLLVRFQRPGAIILRSDGSGTWKLAP